MFSSRVLLLGVLCCTMLVAISARYVSDDMEFAASDKHEEWKKGGGKDHFEDEHSSHGDKGEKGYKESHEHDEGKILKLRLQ
jgi:hypothetical protein